ncbi:MAG: membrane integrity-associated transporter subunit PqiC [Acidobacteria bacterium]|nr:MAG: membrane integrity-associated transporter subunit PqiC [Acidobacteriota bacterium]
MRRMMRFTLVALAMAALSGCLGGKAIKYYTAALPPAPEPATSTLPFTLLIGHIGAPEILEDQPIVYRSGPNEIGTYEYHQWAEPPTQMVKTLLIRRLRASGRYQSVAQLGSSAQGEFALRGRLFNFEEVDQGGAISALVSMEFELIDRETHKTVWNRFYTHTEPVQGKDIPKVVAALDRNLEQGLAEVESGLEAYFTAHPPQKP